MSFRTRRTDIWQRRDGAANRFLVSVNASFLDLLGFVMKGNTPVPAQLLLRVDELEDGQTLRG